jgi:hypothetical protein
VIGSAEGGKVDIQPGIKRGIKVGIALSLVGFILFFAFFFGVAAAIATPADVHDRTAFRHDMDNDSVLAGVSFAISALGMLLMSLGGTVLFVSIGRALFAHARAEADRQRAMATCSFCGSAMTPTGCVRCGAAGS